MRPPARLFALCDLDMDFPELGHVSLAELTAVRLPFGPTIERDSLFHGRVPLMDWTDTSMKSTSYKAVRANPVQ